MTGRIHLYKVPSALLAVRTYDKQHCLKCKCKTDYSMVYDYRFKIISENRLIQKSRCVKCDSIKRSFCKFKRYSVTTGYPYAGKQYKMNSYVTPTWVSAALDSTVVSYEEMKYQQMEYKSAKPKLRRTKLPRKYPHNRTQPYPPTPDMHNLTGDAYVRAIRGQGQPPYPQVQQPGPYSPAATPNPNHNRDYYNYRNNLVEPSEEGE